MSIFAWTHKEEKEGRTMAHNNVLFNNLIMSVQSLTVNSLDDWCSNRDCLSQMPIQKLTFANTELLFQYSSSVAHGLATLYNFTHLMFRTLQSLSEIETKYGVPQGSIFGSLCFNINIIILAQTTEHCNILSTCTFWEQRFTSVNTLQ